MRSLEPDEDWGWCYVDEIFLSPHRVGLIVLKRPRVAPAALGAPLHESLLTRRSRDCRPASRCETISMT